MWVEGISWSESWDGSSPIPRCWASSNWSCPPMVSSTLAAIEDVTQSMRGHGHLQVETDLPFYYTRHYSRPVQPTFLSLPRFYTIGGWRYLIYGQVRIVSTRKQGRCKIRKARLRITSGRVNRSVSFVHFVCKYSKAECLLSAVLLCYTLLYATPCSFMLTQNTCLYLLLSSRVGRVVSSSVGQWVALNQDQI